jgi:hypothetical protein
MPSYKKVKMGAKIFYDKWRKTSSFCPAFNCNVKISLKGWRHLVGSTGNTKRTLCDSYRRLMLLPYAQQITEMSTTIQNVSTKNGTTYYCLEAVINVSENGKTGLRKVRVIYFDDKKGNKTFLSVMDKKPKPKKPKK